MVNALVNRAATVNQATTYLRNLSTATPTNNPPTTSSADGPKKPKREKKNLFEVAQFLPNWGISYHMSKTHWTSVSYEITKINLYKDGRHGNAWGLAYKDGESWIYCFLSIID
uniref:Uncharacterized protein n=2 Tax=Nicotiana TaxID=4085 RepID=A0A1S4AL78_TOBAC|nr:PREDICTED: uncharacterized protein LOC104229542 [Nicotiana sylvestris]XP_016477355.1 PREDICTED: uncharacterized protein LOC107798839 [Nicotiana tabacum]